MGNTEQFEVGLLIAVFPVVYAHVVRLYIYNCGGLKKIVYTAMIIYLHNGSIYPQIGRK